MTTTSGSAAAAVREDADESTQFDVGARVAVAFPGDPTVWEATVRAVNGDSYSVQYRSDGELEDGLDRAVLSQWRDDNKAEELDIDELILEDRVGEGTQSEVLLGKLPSSVGLVAVKLGLKHGAVAREAVVLSAMSGTPGFPMVLHHEPDGPGAPGGFMVMELLGPSLEDLRQSQGRQAAQTEVGLSTVALRPRLSGPTLLRIGREVLRLLRQLHLAGFVHNDVKPANLLLNKGKGRSPRSMYLIDFGSCTRAEGRAVSDGGAVSQFVEPASGPKGTALFASVAADEGVRPMRPADDIESLAYTLTYLAAGSLPWKRKPDAVALSMKQELLASTGVQPEKLTEDVHCSTAAPALQALWAEVRRCCCDGASVDYEACLSALCGGASELEAKSNALSEVSLMAALGGSDLEEGVVSVAQPPAWVRQPPAFGV